MRAPSANKAEAAAALARLAADIKQGDKIYTVTRSISSTGVGSRRLTIHGIACDGQESILYTYTYNVALALGIRFNKKDDTVTIRGTGFNHGGEIVGNLARRLFGDERALRHESI